MYLADGGASPMARVGVVDGAESRAPDVDGLEYCYVSDCEVLGARYGPSVGVGVGMCHGHCAYGFR